MLREALEETLEGAGDATSASELEMLLLIARGISNRQISTTLTFRAIVKRYFANTYQKMRVSSRGGATKKASWEGGSPSATSPRTIRCNLGAALIASSAAYSRSQSSRSRT